MVAQGCARGPVRFPEISRKTAACKCDASLRAGTRGKGKLKQKEKSRETKSEREGKKKKENQK